jgi:hypothetical protein
LLFVHIAERRREWRDSSAVRQEGDGKFVAVAGRS